MGRMLMSAHSPEIGQVMRLLGIPETAEEFVVKASLASGIEISCTFKPVTRDAIDCTDKEGS